MRKLIVILSIVSLPLWLLQCTSNERALNKKLQEMATNLNESVPIMLDQYTRFEGASVTSDNKFRYQYTVLNTPNPDSLVENGLQSLKENIEKEFFSNPDLRIFKENNVVIEYVYNDENGRTIRSLQITPPDYQ
ncbi:hypothetical protein SAMN05216365_13627 [Porphyromonadaceae bacterium NLAE-zl-C104]|uniref:hypothetical protein n=1 Tax=Proteiniphilum TaxID=294702 RepID=UPI0008964F80|nr:MULTISPECIES: hypothetical protein [Proteiniphilum]MDY9918356.1 hypothetical protein [Proteiniphilum sp.]SDZ80210.1 hypothetical protein SAMN05216331_104108 [Porphyromonadaceae bacterium KH3R12]SFL03271.1 hypothetical protein SAMN05216357_11128 [Porphyromonadaceae bacterium KH3CP3RA]SFS96785.1 hypothetical protein SAMN05216365_13627 [Porphyromonadaceae bacterium NLAE-zl-C104]